VTMSSWRTASLYWNSVQITACTWPLNPTGSLWRRQSQQSFNTSTPPLFSFSLHVSAPTGHLQIKLDIFKNCFYQNGSVARTQLDVEMLYVLHRYFDSWSPIHVIKLSTNIKIVKSWKFLVETGPIYKM
jgi:hypothetical protein